MAKSLSTDPLFSPFRRRSSAMRVWCSITQSFKEWQGERGEAFFGLAYHVTSKAKVSMWRPTYWYKANSKHGRGLCSGKARTCPACAASAMCQSVYKERNAKVV